MTDKNLKWKLRTSERRIIKVSTETDDTTYTRMGKEFTNSQRGSSQLDLSQSLLQKRLIKNNPSSSVMTLR